MALHSRTLDASRQCERSVRTKRRLLPFGKRRRSRPYVVLGLLLAVVIRSDVLLLALFDTGFQPLVERVEHALEFGRGHLEARLGGAVVALGVFDGDQRPRILGA